MNFENVHFQNLVGKDDSKFGLPPQIVYCFDGYTIFHSG